MRPTGPGLFTSLIRRCVDTKSITDIKKLQTQITKSGYILGFGDKLIDGYVKCGEIFSARKLFDEMPQRHIVTWNSMIATHIGHRRTKEAIGLYKMMISEGVFPDKYTFSSIFKGFSEMGCLREGQKAHGLSVVLGLESSNVFVGTALVDMYSKLGRMRDAKLVADRVVDKDVVLFTALIVGYAQLGQDSEALGVFVSMINQGVKANEYTYASILIPCGDVEDIWLGKVIHGLVLKSGCEAFVASQTSLITMYYKCGLIDNSLNAFQQFANPNLVMWTSIIVGLVQNGREEDALKMFKQMICTSISPNSFTSISPNSFTLSTALRACSSMAMLVEGRQIHAITTKCGLDRGTYCGAALVDMYGKCGSTDLSKSVFDSITEPDVVSINCMIHIYGQNGLGQEALELYNRMKELRLQPNDATFVSVLSACNNAGLVEEGVKIFASLKKNPDIELTKAHYTCMVDLLGRSGRLQEAEKLIKQVSNPDIVLWRSLLNACAIHGNAEMAGRIKDNILDIAPQDEGTHVLLSNVYALTGKWNQVIQVKTTMREMKLRKDPAMTWVEIDREVHTFMAGECSHPQSKQILETLGELMVSVKNAGYVPDTHFVLQNFDEERKERSLYYHSEKLAIAFALWRTGNKTTSIRIFKNLRVCGDCHNWIKYVCKVVNREIISRDAKRFHHFKDGSCSCGDYW